MKRLALEAGNQKTRATLETGIRAKDVVLVSVITYFSLRVQVSGKIRVTPISKENGMVRHLKSLENLDLETSDRKLNSIKFKSN